MKKEIPIYFDSVIIASPAQPITESKPELGRLKVGVFTKYGNRNGSYITDEIAEMLIASAIRGNTPVVGFYDPESEGWAGHTGPLLASAYGYVENFEGWQPFKDTDGIEREYAVFSVVLFNEYYEEANFVVGQHQSMELNRKTIEGDWANIGDTEYFVYTKASIMGLCIIGDHEPCFSVSTFFSKKDENYESQYEKFSSLLSGLKEQVEEAELNKKGGEQPMNELENIETPVENTVEDTPEQAQNFEEAPAAEGTPVEDEPAAEPATEETPAETPAENPVDFEALQAQIETLQNANNELTTNYENAQARIAELEQALANANASFETATARITELETSVAEYAAERAQVEEENKNNLIEKYAKVIDEEEIGAIRAEVNNFSYSELESKLAITFANKQMAGSV
jgi:hypothetical protein